jgi:gp16 family phage-associated protein
MKPKTPEEVRREFREAGISVAGWARAHGFDRMTVVDLLRGTRKGNYGEAHRAAVALGLKAGKLVDVMAFKPLPAAAPSTTGGARQRKAA